MNTKGANAIQWAAIAVVLAAGLFVWFRPKRAAFPRPMDFSREAAALPDIPAAQLSNHVVVGVAPLQNQSQTALRSKTIPARAQTLTEEILSQMDGVVTTRTMKPRIVVIPTILEMHDERKQFKGYGIESKSVVTSCSVRVQVIDGTGQSVAFSKILTGEKAETDTGVSKVSMPEDERQFDAVAAALHKLEGDADFKNAVTPTKI